MMLARSPARKASAIVIVGAGLGLTSVAADTFDIKTLDYDKGRTYLEASTSFFHGFPANADRLRASFDPTLNYAVTDRWLTAVKASMNKPIRDEFRVSTVGIEQTYALRKLDAGVAFGLYGGVNAATFRGETNNFAFGPIVTLGTETTQFTINPALDKTFGQNHVEGIAFTYGWQAKHELQKGYAIGIEGYGTVQNMGAAPTLAEQPHRIGPVLYLERELSRASAGNGPKGLSIKEGLSIKDTKSSVALAAGGSEASAPPKIYMEAGVLFGLTEGTQNTVFKLKGGIEY
jgi:hypothetical protein